MELRIEKEMDFSYILRDVAGEEVGRIDALCYREEIQIIRFCVGVKYRGMKFHYGKQLLDCIVSEAETKGIAIIFVIPKGEELYDDVEPMNLQALYTKYEKLGFVFKEKELKPYDNVMVKKL